ncbi:MULTISPECIES: hypothetical protein [unclassified Streptomyces]|uniref:Uncharacterized protein n=1 Tax=Streptomyces johnsoniae TaxID=3075532 RepID=A0ABU2S9T5_9ACTN|nr:MULTISPECIES: hypothetical protein [unclassified Streptomyces]MDT0445736.1 hypothetical protein [Streptomyces sp. DSM 41886]ONK15399.1 hypothetical protein STBA_62150 [Streptomyces sp. MP131-18]
MKQITARSGPPRVPAINCGSSANSARLDRHLSVLSGPAVPQREAEEATTLMRELTQRDEKALARARRGPRVLLVAPLRRLRRTLFGGRG